MFSLKKVSEQIKRYFPKKKKVGMSNLMFVVVLFMYVYLDVCLNFTSVFLSVFFLFLIKYVSMDVCLSECHYIMYICMFK